MHLPWLNPFTPPTYREYWLMLTYLLGFSSFIIRQLLAFAYICKFAKCVQLVRIFWHNLSFFTIWQSILTSSWTKWANKIRLNSLYCFKMIELFILLLSYCYFLYLSIKIVYQNFMIFFHNFVLKFGWHGNKSIM